MPGEPERASKRNAAAVSATAEEKETVGACAGGCIPAPKTESSVQALTDAQDKFLGKSLDGLPLRELVASCDKRNPPP